MEKLIVMIMGQNCEKFIKMCLDSTEDADARIYCDGGSTDSTLDIVENRIGKKSIISNKYDQEDKKMNGKQRNFYLKYLKENYPDHWALCLDADEVVEDLSKIKEFINDPLGEGLFSVKMRHLIQDLAHEDATAETHYVLNRLFKINKADKYPEVEHPVLQGEVVGGTACTTIWHLAYIPNLWDIKKRYDSHMKKSQMHTPEYLASWYKAHLFGQYPTKQFNPVELPKVILDEFGLDKDELYFMNRGLETKHFIMAKQWHNFFDDDDKMFEVLEFGCGRAPYGYAFDMIDEECYMGIELSKYAVDNSLLRHDVLQGNVIDCYLETEVKLVIAFDLLEHLKYKDLDKAINNIINHSSKYILISVPVLGDPNLEADPTHIIKETKEWWIKQFTDKDLKLIKTPEHFLFKEQIMIFEK